MRTPRSAPDRRHLLARVGRLGRSRATGGTLALLSAGALLAACSSATPAAKGPTTTTRKTSSGSTTTTTRPPTSSTTTSTTAASTTATVCSSGVLRLSEGGVATAAGTSHLTFVLTNEGPSTCTLEGYPAVALFGASGAGGAGAGPELDLTNIEVGPAPATVSVAPGHTASFLLSVSEVPVNGGGCENVASLQVTPPSTVGALSVPADFQACGGNVGVYAVTAGS